MDDQRPEYDSDPLAIPSASRAVNVTRTPFARWRRGIALIGCPALDSLKRHSCVG
jgi:hypothetical protein